MEKIKPNFEKKSSIERVVGASKEQQEDIKKIHAQQFEKQDIEKLRAIEFDKTPEQIKIIDLINEETNKLLAKYNLPEFDIPSNNVHLVDEKAYRELNPLEEDKFTRFSPAYQAVFTSKSQPKFIFAERIYHEFIHFKSYQAMQRIFKNEQEFYELYRAGFILYSRDGEREYFRNLNEAVTEELTKRFYFQQLKNEPSFEKEVGEVEQIREKWLAKAKTEEDKTIAMDIAELRSSDKKGTKAVLSFTYWDERNILNNLIDKLYQKNQQKFHDREEVFDLFAKAMLGGNLLPVGKLVDRTFGPGVFRKIGESDANIKEQEDFINGL